MHLSKIEDPRDLLQKATRKELERYAKSLNVSQVRPGMPADLMRDILRSLGHTGIESVFPNLHNRQLGQINGVNADRGMPPPGSPVKEVSAADLLLQQWESDQQSAPPQEIEERRTKPKNEMAALRAECKQRGITIARTDKMDDLKAKLHGEDVTQYGQ